MKLPRLLRHTLWAFLSLMLTLFTVLLAILIYFEFQLPDVDSIRDFHMELPLKIYTIDGKLIAELGQERRNPISIDQIPKPLIQAVLATEDQHFFTHGGIDLKGLLRAVYVLITTGTKAQGGSTITMQVARNYFLSAEKTYTRKIKEILLALKIDRNLTKDQILELYFNKIYFGQNAYGIAAAAQIYYGKPLNQLTLPELAMLAGLPKAPSYLNPITNPRAALDRRNHVLYRMLVMGYIDKKTYQSAIKTPLTAKYHGHKIEIGAPYVADMVKQAIQEKYGNNAFTSGYSIYTTIRSSDQLAANHALRTALFAYDHRHGFRGPLANLGHQFSNSLKKQWQQQLQSYQNIADLVPVVIINLTNSNAEALTKIGTIINIPWQTMYWARKNLGNNLYSAYPKTIYDVLKIGDVVYVQKQNNQYALSQLPQVEGALIALNPNDGAIFALNGGFSYKLSNFNRITQAERQPGSNFKPFIYAAALEKGFTLASMINDAPIVVNDPSAADYLWRPQNDTKKFYGMTRLKVGLTKSRNLVSIRLLQAIGIDNAINYVTRFGFMPQQLPHSLSLALGSASLTPLQIATGYAVFANGGYKIQPYLIAKIIDGNNQIIYQAKPAIVPNQTNQNLTNITFAPRVISPQIAYLMVHAMKDVIKQGTGRAALTLKRNDLAGKTGTTNQQMDAWFSGFNRNIVVTCWVGYDQPQSLYEYGAQAALPMWITFMQQVLKEQPEAELAMPSGIVSARIDKNTGLLAEPDDKDAIFELFRAEEVPQQFSSSQQNDNNNDSDDWNAAPIY